MATTAATRSTFTPTSRRQGLTTGLWLLSGAGVVWGLFSPQPALVAACWLSLPLLLHLLWRSNEPPILFVASLKLWLTAALQALYYAGYRGISLDTVYGGPELTQASWLSLISVVVLAAGMRLGLLGFGRFRDDWDVPEVLTYAPKNIFLVYIGAFVVVQVLEELPLGGGIRQFVLALLMVRWVLFFLLTYVVLARDSGYPYLIGGIAFEIIFGLLGFFSGFKEFIMPFGVAALAAPRKIEWKEVVGISAVIAILIWLGLFWTTIKPEYRDFLRQGSQQQVVRVSVFERFEKIYTLATTVRTDEVAERVEPLIERIGYVEFFAHTLAYVPEFQNYENGERWQKAIMHVLMPRLIFPDKPVLDDTEVMRKYTGRDEGQRSTGTSINIGYFAESYVDFGPLGMFVPLLVLGLGAGLIQRFLLLYSPYPLLAFATACAMLVFILSGIPSAPKLLGGLLVKVIILTPVLLLGGPHFVRWMQSRNA